MSRYVAIAQRALTVLPPFLALLPFLALALPAEAGAQQDNGNGDGVHTLVGTIYDSLAATPLADAVVQLVARGDAGRVLSTRTDAEGAFQLSDLPGGRYLVGFMHPNLDSLGIELPPRLVELSGDSVVHVALAIPSTLTIRGELCAISGPEDDSTGLVLGFIRDADGGMPLDSAAVLVSWTELVAEKKDVHVNRRELRVPARSNGWYAICGAPSDAPLTARAERGGASTGDVQIVVPPRGLVHRDFSIATLPADVAASDKSEGSAGALRARGNARLTGSVRNEQGTPLGGALVTVQGTGISASSGQGGRFLLSNLPAGTRTLEVRYVGYAPKQLAVDLFSAQTRSITVTLDERVDVLRDVTVVGRRRRELSDFLERRDRGMGHFITREQIAKQHRPRFTDLFRTIPGVRVAEKLSPDANKLIFSDGPAGACEPQVYVDGVLLVSEDHLNTLVRPDDVAAVEIYKASEAPVQYQTGGCGTILIWMGPGLDSAERD